MLFLRKIISPTSFTRDSEDEKKDLLSPSEIENRTNWACSHR